MIYAFLADGFEEVEAITAVDIIRRANIEICTVGIDSKTVCGSHGICVVCDLDEKQLVINDDFDGILLPGGMPGTLNLEKSKTVNEFIDYSYKNNKLICAICAAPSILGHKGLLNKRSAVCFPGFEKDLEGAVLENKFVATDDNIITAKGMGSTIDFALAVVEKYKGAEFAQSLKTTLQTPY